MVRPARRDAAVAVAVVRAAVQNFLGAEGRFLRPRRRPDSEIHREGGEPAFIRSVKRIVIALFLRRGDQWRELSRLCVGIGHQKPGYAAVAVLEGMDARELVVQPGGFRLRREVQPRMPFVELQEPLDFLKMTGNARPRPSTAQT